MTSVQIRFATSILSRLGEELTPSPDLGIIELVKNAYDADANSCTIRLVNTDEAGGDIIIVDDGDGMTDEDIQDGWLVLGKSRKDSHNLTRLKRIPAGNKGLGRLAALRMGHSVSLNSCPRTSADKCHKYHLKINWDVYDEVDLVDQVDLVIDKLPCLVQEQPGTQIKIENLRQAIKRSDVKKLARGLILLADPFGDDPEGFQPLLVAPEYADLEKLVKQRYLDDAEFHMISEVDADGHCHAKVYDWRGELLYKATHEDIFQRRPDFKAKQKEKATANKFECPPARFEIWIFVLDGQTFSTRKSTIADVRTWLKEFGGIHLYQNRLRVSPYGNPGNDWIDMNLLRGRNPELRPGTNTSIGRVQVLDPNSELIQKTDRAGFIETENFQELKLFVQSSLEWLAIERINERDRKRVQQRTETPKESTRSKKHVQDRIGQLPPAQQQPIREAFQSYDTAREQEVKQLREEVQLYRTLSTAGITAATFAHESSGNPLKVLSIETRTVERRSKSLLPNQYDSQLKESIDRIIYSLDSLAVLGNVTLRLIDHEKRRVSRVDLHQVIKEVIQVFTPFLKSREVNIKLNLCLGNPYLRGSAAAIESIITNLLNNSLVAFESSPDPLRIIEVNSHLTSESEWTMHLKDNGPGIVDIDTREIWLPGRTTRENGTGLGLTIVRDAVADLGGKTGVVAHSSLGGAEFIISLPILGV